MNKRIENLFEQALDEAVPETWTTLNPVQLMRLRDKFAELIVRECAGVAEELSKPTLYPEKVGFDVGYTMGTARAAKDIKERFGVEE